MKYRIVALLFTVHCALYIQAQEFSGYVSEMPSVIWQNQSSDMWWQNLLHNRLNFGWQLSENWRIDAGMRNRFMTGSEAMLDPESAGFDNGWADLSWNWATGQKALGNTTFDRLHITFEKDKAILGGASCTCFSGQASAKCRTLEFSSLYQHRIPDYSERRFYPFHGLRPKPV
jgi:hypothetical protein